VPDISHWIAKLIASKKTVLTFDFMPIYSRIYFFLLLMETKPMFTLERLALLLQTHDIKQVLDV
jgi:hypothetical protein